MKKVMQTVTGLGGNCEGATLATLLDLNIEDIPDFWEGIDKNNPTAPGSGTLYQENLNRFLRKHGYKMLNLGVDKNPSELDQNWVIEISKAIGTKHLVAGISPRGHMHSVIYEHGQLWHDPHPEGGGVLPCQICLLVPLFDSEVESEKPEYILDLRKVTIFDERNGMRAVTEDKKYSIGNGGGLHSPEQAIISLVELIAKDHTVIIDGCISEVTIMSLPY